MKASLKPWGMTPIAILLDKAVTQNMLRVYVVLASFQGANDECYPSRVAIAQRAGLPETRVSENLTALEEAGWVKRRFRADNQTNIYTVLIEAESEGVTESVIKGVTESVIEGVTESVIKEVTESVTHKTTDKTTDKTTKKTAGAIELSLAGKLLEYHRKKDPAFIDPKKETETLERWAVDIEKMIRIDKIDPARILSAIKWSQQDSFWFSNILSGRKLREKFETMRAQAISRAPKPGAESFTADQPAQQETGIFNRPLKDYSKGRS